MQEKKYGLQLRVPKSQQRQPQTRPPIPKVAGFNDDDDDDVEREISRQAAKNKSLKDVEQQHKIALEEDPSVFDYDGVYDDMKSKIAQPRVQDRQQRQPKYIQKLMEKAKQREREQEIVYERKLAKERSKDDDLYADKDKFVTGAYKRKLAEQAKWMEEERLRELREQKDDVTKKSDLTDFYFNLSKNVAFGGPEKSELKNPTTLEKEPETRGEEPNKPDKYEKEPTSVPSSSRSEDKRQGEGSRIPERSLEPPGKPTPPPPPPPPPTSEKEKPPLGEQQPEDQPKRDHHKKGVDALAAAKERFLARKRAKVD